MISIFLYGCQPGLLLSNSDFKKRIIKTNALGQHLHFYSECIKNVCNKWGALKFISRFKKNEYMISGEVRFHQKCSTLQKINAHIIIKL